MSKEREKVEEPPVLNDEDEDILTELENKRMRRNENIFDYLDVEE